jgi:hypothetical protein
MTPRRLILSTALVMLVLLAGRRWPASTANAGGLGGMCEPETRPVRLSVEPIEVGDLGDRVTGPATVGVEAPGAVWVQLEVWPVETPAGGPPLAEPRVIGAVSGSGDVFRILWNATEPWPYVALSARAFSRDTCSRTSEPVPIILDRRDPAARRSTGIITGWLSYPSEGAPPMTVYAIRLDLNSMRWVSVNTVANQTAYMITDLEPGIYAVVAYLQTGGTLAGAYTESVHCGLTVECKDHTLIPVTVTAGDTVTGVDIRDWYAPPGTFPPRPEP